MSSRRGNLHITSSVTFPKFALHYGSEPIVKVLSSLVYTFPDVKGMLCNTFFLRGYIRLSVQLIPDTCTMPSFHFSDHDMMMAHFGRDEASLSKSRIDLLPMQEVRSVVKLFGESCNYAMFEGLLSFFFFLTTFLWHAVQMTG